MAKKFHFTLQKVLDVRVGHRKQEERNLAMLRSQLHQLEGSQNQLRQEIAASFSLDPAQALNWQHLGQHYRSDCAGQIARMERDRQALAKREIEVRQQLVNRSREEKILLRLRDRMQAEYQQELGKAEQKELEELDLLKRGRS
jgi:flagellar FliJ protein